MSHLLEIRGVSKQFPGVLALDNVDFHIDAGEVVALIGENGAGKSTMMKALGGVHQPSSGKIFVDGNEVTIATVADSQRLGIGFVHQELNVLDNLDVAANVWLGREIRNVFGIIKQGELRKRTQPFLDRLGLKVSADQLLSSLSIGQQQLVEIAKALSLDSRLIIMDEPTSSLTLTETDRLLEVIEDLRSQGIAIVYISHRLGEIEQCADRVVALRDGCNSGGLEKAEINHDAMVALMIGRELDSAASRDIGTVVPGFLKVRGLVTRAYPEQQVSFDIAAGEILGMAGLMGAGRSEVAQALFGVDPALGGKVTIDGKSLGLNNTRNAIDAGLFLAPEDRKATGLVTDFNITENTSLADMNHYSSLGLIRHGREREVAVEQINALGVKTPSEYQLLKNLSGGNQQKVVLGKWLAMKPKVLIVDEPTRGIDVGAKREIYQLLYQLASEGVAILMISSDMEELLLASDRILVMSQGDITGEVSRADFDEETIMQYAVTAPTARSA